MKLDEYLAHDGLGLAKLVQGGEVTPAELVEIAIAQAERVNPALNAIVYPMYDEGRRVATSEIPAGPFQGVPFLLKDHLSLYAGTPTTFGTKLLKDYVPDHDSEMVRRFKRSGLVTLGKTNTPEMGLMPYTESELLGPCRNPWDPSRTPGGSSGGSGAAIAAGIVPLAGGADGGGSIRIPASCCGLFGLKPTRARTPTGPDHGELWRGGVVEHVITRSVRDSAVMLDAVAGPDVGAPYTAPPPARPFAEEVGADPGHLRIAFTGDPLLGKEIDPDCLVALADAAKLLETLGHHVEEAAPPVDRGAFSQAFVTMLTGELRADIQDAENAMGRKATWRDMEPAAWALGLLGRRVSAAEYASAVRYLQRYARVVGHFFEDYDVLLTPTLSRVPPPIGAFKRPPFERLATQVIARMNAGRLMRLLGAIEQVAENSFEFTPFTPLFNVTGQPAMSVPLSRNAQGLPIGLHFAGRYADEATLIRLASQLEEACPWFDQLPPWVREGQE
jgi:amidase